jgi:hypothetical protein
MFAWQQENHWVLQLEIEHQWLSFEMVDYLVLVHQLR